MLLLHHAYLQNDLETFSKLIESTNTTQVGSRKKKQSAQAQVLDVNQVDKFGRTVLHLAASDGQLEFVQCLVTAKQLNLLKADRESGWTALHRALYNGKVAIARLLLQQVPPRGSAFQGLVQACDLEGNTPFDVYNSTIGGVGPDVHDFNLGSSDLFTFGSNANHTLGFADNDDRVYPERVNIVSKALLKGPVRFQAPKIRDVQMAKYHTLVITNESVGNLYVCGFAKEGRLGLPGGTRFKFEPISIECEICSIAIAQDHSLALTTDGEIFSWGSNAFRQLGYDTEKLNYEAAPRKILKSTKDRVHGIAVSLIHSVFYTTNGLYTWGANEGQLGHEANASEQFISSPRKVASIVAPIIQCTASRFATTCLMQSQEVLVLTGYGYFKLAMQLERFAFELGARMTNRTLHLNQVTKIVSGHKTTLFITNIGDVYEVVIGETASRSKASILGKSIRPNRVWSPKKRHLAVRDAAVGIEGTIIIVTESGMVLTGTRRTSKKSDALKSDYKFNLLSGITRAVQVRGSDHGSYAVIRQDVPLKELHLGATDLSEDLLCALPYAEDILEEDEHDLTTIKAIGEYDETDEIDVPLPQHVINATEMLQKDDLPDFVAHESHDLIMVLNDGFRIPLHTTVCSARSPLLTRALQGTKIASLTLIGDRDPKELKVEMPVSRIAAVLVVHWLYTGIILKPWLGCDNAQRPLMLTCQHQAMQFARFLELTSLTKFLEKPFSSHNMTSLGQSFGRLQHNMTNSADCRIHLADGTIETHSAVLCARSEFFDAMFSGAWLSARREENGADRIDIRLQHISLAVMELVIDHIFSDRDLALFDESPCADVDEFLDLVMQVLAVANELILPRLKEVCQVIIRQHVHRKTISLILEEADRYHADDLKSACLLYCAQNLQLLIENNLLSDTNQVILQDLDHTIARLQTDKMPVSKSNLLISELIQRNPSMLDEREANRKHYLEELLTPTNTRTNLLLFPKKLIKPSSSSSPFVRPNTTEDALIFEMDKCDITSLDQSSLATQHGQSVEHHGPSDFVVSSTDVPIPNGRVDSMSQTMGWQTVQHTKAIPVTSSPAQQRVPAKAASPAYYASPATPLRQPQSERKKSAQSLHGGSYGASGSSPKMWSPLIHTPVSMKDIMSTESRPVSSSSETKLPTSPLVAAAPSVARLSSSLQRPSVLASSISPSNNGRSFSLAQIIAAEEQEKTKVIEYQAKRSMKEIQEAEVAAKQAADFEKWFQEESKRLQAEQNPQVNGAKHQRNRKGKKKKTDTGSSSREKH